MAHLIPNCLHRPGDDPIFALNAKAQERRAAGDSVVNATLGALMEDDGTLALMPSVFEAFSEVPMARAAAYAPIAGPREYLEAVRRDVFSDEELVRASVSVATPGGTGAVYAALVNFLEHDQALLTTDYYWGPYKILADHTRRRVETFPMFDAAGRLDLGALERKLAELAKKQGRILLVLNFPCHNPTGYTLDAEEWDAVVASLRRIAGSVPTTLLLDMAYASFAEGGQRVFERLARDLGERVLVCAAWTASKAFVQYGGRIGALIAHSRDAAERKAVGDALSYSCRGTWSNCNHLGMLAIARILQDDALRARSSTERQRLVALLTERVDAFNAAAPDAGLEYPRYEGGFFVTVFTPDAQLTTARMQEDGVFVVPLDGAVRVALCSTPTSDVGRVVDSLGRAIGAARAATTG